jgi:hypothetical protein
MSENTQQTGATDNGTAGELREVPKDISEYKKFVAGGGHEHNAQVVGREAAVAAAKVAGILPDPEPGEAQEHKQRSSFQHRVARLQRKIGERDARIADLQKRLDEGSNGAAPATNGTAPAASPNGTAARASSNAKAADPASRQIDTPGGEKKAPPRPVETDFKTYGEFIEALTEWKTDRKLAEAEDRRRETARLAEAETKNKTITDAHNLRVDEAKTRYPDWDKAFNGLDDNSFTDPMVVFIFESESGPDVTYYLATHRDELERIQKLSPLRQAAALGKIEDQFAPDDAKGEKDEEDEEEEDEEGAAAKKKPEAPEPRPARRVSTAPPPAKPLGGRGGGGDQMPDPKDFAAYSAWSKRQAAKGVKR